MSENVEQAKAKWQVTRCRFEANLLRIIAKYEFLDSTLGCDPDHPELEISDDVADDEGGSSRQQQDATNPPSANEKYFEKFFGAVGTELSDFGANKQICSLYSLTKKDFDEKSFDSDFESENDEGVEEDEEYADDLVSHLAEMEQLTNTQKSLDDGQSCLDFACPLARSVVDNDRNLKRAFVCLTKISLPSDLKIDPILTGDAECPTKRPRSGTVVNSHEGNCSVVGLPLPRLSREVFFCDLGSVRLPTLTRLNVTFKVPRGILEIVAEQAPCERLILRNFYLYERAGATKIDHTLNELVREVVLKEKFEKLLEVVGKRIFDYQWLFKWNKKSADFVDFTLSLDAGQQKALVALVD